MVLTGTGTSQGIPVIGCRCEVCISKDERDKRLRTAAFIAYEGTHVAVDAGPDFRQQMLNLGITHLDALIITHEHNDHVAGLDDIRPFNFIQRKPLKVYTLQRVADEIRRRFAYIFSQNPYPGAPTIEMIVIKPYEMIEIGALSIMPLLVKHGDMEVLAMRSGAVAYVTDANEIPSRSMQLLQGTDNVVINALHHRSHHSHFNLLEAMRVAKQIGAKNAYFTHISHQMGLHAEVNQKLPAGFSLGFDQQTIRI
ncbi:MAG: MBL fold metallo-hydrolase [Saprospiraceae bacterium]|nr:MBL fold metallo-hydrolase [Saprospiraceae bacterium]